MRYFFKNILFFLTVFVLLIPLVVQKANIHFTPLNGSFENADTLVWTVDHFLDRSWQKNREDIIKKNLNIRPQIVRMEHEFDHQLFKEYHMYDLLVGKDGFLFSENWAKARCTESNFDKEQLVEFIRDLKEFETELAREQKYFGFIIPPSKEELYYKFLPKGSDRKVKENNYEVLKEMLNDNDVKYWDLFSYYSDIIDTSSYPVYSKTSVHWTNYGAQFTTTKIIEDMEHYFGKKMNELGFDSLRISKWEGSDGDHEKTLNLLSRIDDSDFAYPYYKVISNSENPYKPKVLIIGDSFYWSMAECWKLPQIFHEDSKYLYYYSTVFPNNSNPPLSIKDINILEEFQNADAVLLLFSSHNLDGFPFGFDKDLPSILETLSIP